MSQIIKISWPEFYTESLLQYSVGRRKNVPSMSLFYPFTYDQYYFSWALSLSWGQIAFPCPEGLNMLEADKFFNAFEAKYAEAFRNQQKEPDCAFLVSRDSFDYTENVVRDTYYPLNTLMQAAYFANIQADVVSEDEEPEAFFRQRCIVAVGIILVSNELCGKLLAFVEKGGSLLIYGSFAEGEQPGKLDTLLNHPNVNYFEWDFCGETMQRSVWCRRVYGQEIYQTAPPYFADFLRHGPGKKLRENLPAEPAAERVTIGFHADLMRQKKDSSKMTLHVLDQRELLVPEGTVVSHNDPMKNYCKDAPLLANEVEIVLNRTDIKSGKLFTPSTDKEITIQPEFSDGKTIIRIPAQSFAGYAAVELQKG